MCGECNWPNEKEVELMDYTIEYLLKEFKKHSEEYEKQKKEYLVQGGKELPDMDFNLPKAFLCMLKEIEDLKNGSVQS